VYPGVVLNQFGAGHALVINADLTPNKEYQTGVAPLMLGLAEWMLLGNDICKIHWELQCGDANQIQATKTVAEGM